MTGRPADGRGGAPGTSGGGQLAAAAAGDRPAAAGFASPTLPVAVLVVTHDDAADVPGCLAACCCAVPLESGARSG